MSQTHSRRTFLKMAAVAGMAGALAACQVPIQAPQAGAPGAQGKLVRILLPSWATGEIPFDTTAREFSDATPGVQVQIQTTFDGWDTKVMAQINQGTVGMERRRHCLVGLVQPAPMDSDPDDPADG